MTKKERRHIASIADKLPIVYEQTVSGYSVEDGRTVPNLVNHPINHERRMCKAYELMGLEGIKKYLDYIKSLQDKRYARFRDAQGSDIHQESDDGDGLSERDGLHGTEH